MRLLATIILGASAILPACAGPAPPPPDQRVHLASSLAALWAEAPVFSADAAGTRSLALVLHNPTGEDIPIVYHVDWYDAFDRPIATALTGERRSAVPREGQAVIDITATGATPSAFRLFLDRDGPLGAPVKTP